MRVWDIIALLMQYFRQKIWMFWFAVLFALLQTIAPLMHAHWQTPSHLLAPMATTNAHLDQNATAGMHLHVEASITPKVFHSSHQHASIGNSQDVEDILELDKSMVRDQQLIMSAVIFFVLFCVINIPAISFVRRFAVPSSSTVSKFLTRATPPRAPPVL